MSSQVDIPQDLAKTLKKFRTARLKTDDVNVVKALAVKITYHDQENERSAMEVDDLELEDEVDLTELAEALPDSAPRYVVLVYWVKYDDGRKTERLALINWVPPNSSTKLLTLHAMAQKEFEKAVNANTVIEVRDGAEGLTRELLDSKSK